MASASRLIKTTNFFSHTLRTYSTPRQHSTNININRAMSSSTTKDPVEIPPQQQESQDTTSSSESHAPLPLPPPPTDLDPATTTKLNVGGEAVKLDKLGPLVVNKDGTLSRIANWEQMADIEKANTLRILGKRNMLRREDLEKKAGEGRGEEGK